MKLLRFGPKGHERPGMLDSAGRIRDLSAEVGDIDGRTLETELPRLRALSPCALPLVDSAVRIGPAVAQVGKIVCVGLNYADHAHETGQAVPAEPILFLKATSSIVGPFDDIILPPGSQKGDWEVELGVVIGRPASYVSNEDALDHVAGVCVINDVSERSYQLERGGQWDKGKGCDTFCPLGPWLVTLDEACDLGSLDLWCKVDGQTMQHGNTRTMIFDVAHLVHYTSQFMSLQPGDVISTGTPPGVGMSMKPPRWLRENDIVELGIAGLGEQRQRVVRYRGSDQAST
ncbi:ureidoglycolate lyase/2,4-diketo-3-deoxy-L-fuconate hydrolase [Povalibacter uvarum]|uniref:Ureidoglycolate lyase/2,4-diketo-3-deoxy-L-fuconate hydrolase n=1 Tax=Povalibacter uvarum TaxID=732238 RepID=A0A841HGI3_9GAMM|nr:fumarylacetoacetate hydrolase family protein [Povalibacter uvarum]MBB6091195.1 ureidoglycolate lyase/2,4-diketo-3-deoxy-L-fuconate hydrolase [Povalibacter uvarum]